MNAEATTDEALFWLIPLDLGHGKSPTSPRSTRFCRGTSDGRPSGKVCSS
jgi:hypothetical protein